MAGKRLKSNKKTTVSLLRNGGIAGLKMTASGNYALNAEDLKSLKDSLPVKNEKLRDAFNHLFEIEGEKTPFTFDQLQEPWKKIYLDLEKKLKFVKKT